MAQEVIQNPVGSPARAAVKAEPLSEGPVSRKDALLRSIAEQCVARLKCRALGAAYQGPKCTDEAVIRHVKDGESDPEAETKAIALSLLPLKFDISREAYGTEDTYVVIKSGDSMSFFALHGLMRQGMENAGLSTLALRLPAALIPDIVAELKADPGFVNEIFHAILPEASALSFSISSRIDVIYDRSYFITPLAAGPSP